MKRYDSYKDTEISWIGEIPSHWEANRMRYIISYEKGKKPKELYFDSEEGMLPYLSMDYLRETFDFTQYSYTEKSSIICKNGDIVLLWDGANAGEFIKSKDGILCSTCALIKPKKISSQYFWYLSKSFQAHLQDMTNGMGVPHVDSEELKNLTAIVPPIEEQEAIAAYLDKKCGNIDGIISTQERRIALLNELKQTIITEAVTRGINPDVPLKDSGIDWIGQIPEHWERTRIKYLILHHSDGIWGDEEKGNDEDIVCYRVADFDYDRMKLRHDNITMRNYSKEELIGREIIEGDLLLEKSGGGENTPVGRVIMADNYEKATCSNFVHLLKIDKSYNNKYLCYYFYALYSNKVNLLFFNQTTGIQNLQVAKYLGQNLFVPPIDEQKAIAAYLDNKCASINSALVKAKREVELLREYKQSVITEAVTGKIKVC